MKILKLSSLTFFLIFIVISITPLNNTSTIQQAAPKDSTYKLYYKLEIPKFFNKDKEKIVQHIAYTLQYDEDHEQAEWVAYELTKDEVFGTVKRKDKFIIDPLVTTGSAQDKDYAGSGYSRGHLAPAADMLFSDTTMKESFYYSNISPQLQKFNNGIWKSLEKQVRQWAIDYNSIYIVTGPVLNDTLKKITGTSLSIPDHFYKVILHYSDSSGKAIAFLMHQKAPKQKIQNFAVPVDSIEKLTKINFFPLLPDSQERKLERKIDLTQWHFR